MKLFIHYFLVFVLSVGSIAGGVFAINNCSGLNCVWYYAGSVLCLAGACAIISEIIKFVNVKRGKLI